MSEDTYSCPNCNCIIDLEKTKIDILLRKFDVNKVNEKLIKALKHLVNELENMHEYTNYMDDPVFKVVEHLLKGENK